MPARIRGRYPATSTPSRRSRASKTAATAASGSSKTAIIPSPSRLTTSPPARPPAARSPRRPRAAARATRSSPASSAQSEKPTRSVNDDREPVVAELADPRTRRPPPRPAAPRGPASLRIPGRLLRRLAQPARDQRARLGAGRRERVAVAAVAGEQLAGDLHRLEQLRPERGADRDALSSPSLGRRPSADDYTTFRGDRYTDRCNGALARTVTSNDVTMPTPPPGHRVRADDHRPRGLLRRLPGPRDDDDVRQPRLDRAADARRLPRRLPLRARAAGGGRRRHGRRLRAGERRPGATSTSTPPPGSATRWARSSTPRPTTRRC